MFVLISIPEETATLFETSNPGVECVSIGFDSVEYQFATVQAAEEAKKAFIKHLEDCIVIAEMDE